MEETLQYICRIEGNDYWDEGYHLYHDSMIISKKYCNGLVGLVFHHYASDESNEWSKRNNVVKEKIPPIYSDITLLRSSNTEVYFLVNKNGKYGLFYCAYDFIIECVQSEYDNITELSEYNHDNIIYQRLPYTYITESNGFYGLYNRIKRITIPCTYERIERIYEDQLEVFYIVTKHGLKGVYNTQGELFIPCLYENITFANHFFFLNKHGLNGVCDKTYKIIVPVDYAKVVYLKDYSFKIYKDGYVGVMGHKTEIYPKYEDIKKLNNDLYAYKLLGKWGIINKDSQIISKPKFDGIKSGKYGIGALMNNHYGIIDTKGEVVEPFLYDKIIHIKWYTFGRIGRKQFLLNQSKTKNDLNFPELFCSDTSCGYDNNTSIYTYDSNLSDLLATPKEE